MSSKHEEIWATAFNACLSGGHDVGEAYARAEDALRMYGDRWPIKYEPPVIGGIDYPMLQRALAVLEHDGRMDAHKVLASLASKLAEAQEQGKKLVDWGPPMRGA